MYDGVAWRHSRPRYVAEYPAWNPRCEHRVGTPDSPTQPPPGIWGKSLRRDSIQVSAAHRRCPFGYRRIRAPGGVGVRANRLARRPLVRRDLGQDCIILLPLIFRSAQTEQLIAEASHRSDVASVPPHTARLAAHRCDRSGCRIDRQRHNPVPRAETSDRGRRQDG